jgi:hypothetical protein
MEKTMKNNREKTMKNNIVKVHVYKYRGEWCYAAWTDEEFDHSDVTGCADDAGAVEVMDDVAIMFAGATISRVDDMDVP